MCDSDNNDFPSDDDYAAIEREMDELDPTRVKDRIQRGLSDGTHDEYMKRGCGIVMTCLGLPKPRKGIFSEGMPDGIRAGLFELNKNPERLIQFFKGRRKDIEKDSFYADRISVEHFLWVMEFPELANLIHVVSSEGCISKANPSKNGPRTSAKKQKHVSPVEVDKILVALSFEKSKYATATAQWVRLSVVFGLRPCEWYTAEILPPTDKEPAIFQVENAKCNETRGHGQYRYFYLDEFSEDDCKILGDFLIGCPSWQNGHHEPYDFKRTYNGCRKLLFKVVKSLWPRRKRRPSLYSGRHQFSADAKIAGAPKVNIAALMGHATDATASHHYAHRMKGTPGAFRLTAHPDNVEDVRRIERVVDFKSLPKKNTAPNAEGSGADQSVSNEESASPTKEMSADSFKRGDSISDENLRAGQEEKSNVTPKNIKFNGGGGDFSPG